MYQAFSYRDNQLFAEDVAITDIVAAHGSPLYIYSKQHLIDRWQAYDRAFGQHPHLICYAVKANSNLAVLNVLAQQGSGFDIVSVGELERVIAAGGDPAKVVFSGLGKTATEIERALSAGIHCFNVESAPEVDLIQQVAEKLNKVAPISLRVNPDVDAKTHPYISTGMKENKFGIDIQIARDVYRHAANCSHLQVVGIDSHIGSQLTDVQPFLDAFDRVLMLVDQLKDDGIELKHIDLGGGLGVCYNDETPPEPESYLHPIIERLGDRNIELLVEPGRFIAANAGIFVTRIEFLKHTEHKDFCVIDGAMNDLIRPSLYSAWQRIIPVIQHDDSVETKTYDVVGPVCESTDFLGKERELRVKNGDLLAVCSAGAYGFVMASNYNTRPRVAEVMVDNETFHVVRQRESLAELFANESMLP